MASRTLVPRIRPLAARTPLIARSYHSYDHPPPPGPFSSAETSILSASLPHIPSHGFTLTSLSLGAKDAGYIDASTNLFPQGPFALVHYHLMTQRLELAEKTSILETAEGAKPLGTGAKVKKLTGERLLGNKDVVHRWQEVCFNSNYSVMRTVG